MFNHPQGRPTARRSTRYGGIPNWLRNRAATAAVGRTVRASAAHPALAIQGAAVSIRLRRGRVLATAAGPNVPREGRLPVPATSPSTFTIRFSAASAAVALSPAQFTIVDELGHVHHPSVRADGAGAPPRQIRPGQTVTLTLHSVLPTGNGRLVWAPDRARPIVAWDFDLEID